MEKLIDLNSPEVSSVIDELLIDKTTGKNIIFAEDDYLTYDKLALKEAQITKGFISKYGDEYVTPRVKKHIKLQSDRTRENAEVFTPSWICNQMINYIDEDWFGYKDVFNKKRGESWTPRNEKIDFKDKNWKDYIESNRLEITCGEAPYLVSRYDTSGGKLIPLEKRIGILDRKIRVVNENVKDEKEWLDWVFAAFKSVYGYEFQGDNLLIARINLYLTFIEYLKAQFNRKPKAAEVEKLVDIICWNIFQMDGLKNIIPFGNAKPKSIQMTIFDEEKPKKGHVERYSDVKIFNWIYNKEVLFKDIRKDGNKMKFDYIIGNPPYQEARETTKDMPVYDKFMDSAYKLSDKVELITPGRFLFNAGATSKSWNKKILGSKHFKVLEFIQKSSKVFPNTDIKGGVAISYYDENQDFGATEIFTPYSELNSVKAKVTKSKNFESLSKIMYPYSTYTISEQFWKEFPEKKERVEHIRRSGEKPDNELSNLRILTTNIFDLMSDLFYDEKPDKGQYCCLLGRKNNSRCFKWIESKYVCTGDNYEKFKVIVPASNGSGAIGEVLSTPLIGEPLIGEPLIGYTQSFLGIGSFDNKVEAENLLKYIKTKFCRAMLGVLKITQHNPPEKWKYVPLLDFSKKSDINWNKSVKEIDEQLYKKYNLSKPEIDFIESKVREMK